jgi:hypothetical protein
MTSTLIIDKDKLNDPAYLKAIEEAKKAIKAQYPDREPPKEEVVVVKEVN